MGQGESTCAAPTSAPTRSTGRLYLSVNISSAAVTTHGAKQCPVSDTPGCCCDTHTHAHTRMLLRYTHTHAHTHTHTHTHTHRHTHTHTRHVYTQDRRQAAPANECEGVKAFFRALSLLAQGAHLVSVQAPHRRTTARARPLARCCPSSTPPTPWSFAARGRARAWCETA
jgi:hypothetical protein